MCSGSGDHGSLRRAHVQTFARLSKWPGVLRFHQPAPHSPRPARKRFRPATAQSRARPARKPSRLQGRSRTCPGPASRPRPIPRMSSRAGRGRGGRRHGCRDGRRSGAGRSATPHCPAAGPVASQRVRPWPKISYWTTSTSPSFAQRSRDGDASPSPSAMSVGSPSAWSHSLRSRYRDGILVERLPPSSGCGSRQSRPGRVWSGSGSSRCWRPAAAARPGPTAARTARMTAMSRRVPASGGIQRAPRPTLILKARWPSAQPSAPPRRSVRRPLVIRGQVQIVEIERCVIAADAQSARFWGAGRGQRRRRGEVPHPAPSPQNWGGGAYRPTSQQLAQRPPPPGHRQDGPPIGPRGPTADSRTASQRFGNALTLGEQVA